MVFGLFRCFDPITGGRISEIVNQEAKFCGEKRLPLSREDDKVEQFCEKYKDFIDVVDAEHRFIKNWEHEKAAAGATLMEKRRFPLILRALYKSFSGVFYKAVFSKLVWSLCVIFSIWFFVFELLDFIKARSKNPNNVPRKIPAYEYWLCAGFFVTMIILSIGIQQMGMFSAILAGKVKAALTTAIFKKMIVRDGYGSKADVVALVAKDVEKIAEASLTVQFLWSGIFETVFVVIVVISIMGKAVLPGIALMCVFLPTQYFLGIIVALRKKTLVKVSNRRIGLMEEIMRGIKLIKMYGWEDSFFKNLHAIRKEEGEIMDKVNRIKATILGLIFAMPPLMCIVIFGTQSATGTIDSVLVFTVLSFFNTLRVPFSKLPKSLRDVMDAFSCFERIQDFLLEPELHPELSTEDEEGEKVKVQSSNTHGIVMRNASLSYGNGGNPVLESINLNIPPGSLMMVAGPVASGKSNLLKSILGDLTVREGTILVSESKAYVPQTPWTALGTVRDNIVFGLPFDDAFYRKVLHACALETDLELMAEGDQTWIGERGGNLSGGQKQRIALARAAYSRAELYVLDSPLSAVDMYTCQHIFKHCIKDLMVGGGGTVVLATHQTELFSLSDHLVVMEGGKMAYNDKYTYSGIKHLFPNFAGDAESIEPIGHESKKEKQSQSEPKKFTSYSKKAQNALGESPGLVKEQKEGNYSWYIKKCGLGLYSMALLIFIIGQANRVYGDYWVSLWTSNYFKQSSAFYAGIYALLVCGFLCLSLLRAFFYFYVGKVGANNVHDASFSATLRAPMHFFHVTPIGKLLSFFTKDIEIIDDMLVDNFLLFWILFWILIMAVALVAYNLILYLAVAGAVAVAFVYVVSVYVRTSVPLKKITGEAVSQVVAHTAETLNGLAVVRAFRVQEKFIHDNLKLQNRSTVANFSLANLSLWLAYRVDFIGCVLVEACAILAVLDASMKSSSAGLIISNSFQILLFFSIMGRTLGEVHDNMNAIDTAEKMASLEPEQEPAVAVEVDSKWPSKGEIRFDGVVMPYLPGKPPVLKGISFSINDGEKIGVVGRTGAGKSSLIVALYRLAEISEGRIHVDWTDCSTVSLNKLRSSMAIIPQEPVMFGGTLRSNLDPFNQYYDEDLLDVLHKCLLTPVLEANPDGLDTKVESMGSNFSLGTQQLICLARAMLNPSRILLLDEATAALDSDTNAAVQQVLKAHFSDRTIFTIAHRLDTIIDSDRILVMNAGVVAEFAPPHELLEDPNSIFYELCMNTGRAQFEVLVARAGANAVAVAN